MDLAVRARPVSALSLERPAVIEALGCPVLAEIAGGLAQAEDLWRAVVRHDEQGRQPVRLLATEAYEVWVIGWTQGQGVELHDHGPSAGALTVVEGALTELAVHGRHRAVRTLAPGPVHDLPVGLVHDVVNTRPEPATSLHVYSPPLTVMHRYDPISLRRVRPEPVISTTPVLPATAAPTLLHPARRWSPVDRTVPG